MKNNLPNLLLPLATLSLASCASQKKEEPKRPNIIFMMTDDHVSLPVSSATKTVLRIMRVPSTATSKHSRNCFSKPGIKRL